MSKKAKRDVQIGEKFYDLEVVDKIKEYNGKKATFCVCKCKCGKEVITAQWYLTSEKQSTKYKCCEQCHKLKNPRGRDNNSFKGYEDLRLGYFNVCKTRAIERGYCFEITIEDAWNQYIKQDKKCALTGESIVISPNSQEKQRQFTIEQTASLDRKDSTKGYTVENIQWIHKKLQNVKWNLSDDEFIEWCHIISRNANQQSNP